MNDRKEDTVVGGFHGLSIIACYMRMYFGETQTPLAHGTCFFVMSEDGPVLITNRHNFTGRNNITGELLHKECSIPDHAVVTVYGPEEVHYHIDLVDHTDPNAPAWTEHPTLGPKADVVAMPVKEMVNIIGEKNSVSLGNDWHRWGVGSDLYVIGYPYGQVAVPFAVWSKGSIASEPDVDVAGRPVFLVDCRTRPGQSGSPVFAYFRRGEIVKHEGKEYAAKTPLSYFVGAYSGRLRSDSDLGLVWKRSCIEELVNHAIVHGTQHKMERRRHVFQATFAEDYSLGQVINDAELLR